jgi:hypothetical protein
MAEQTGADMNGRTLPGADKKTAHSCLTGIGKSGSVTHAGKNPFAPVAEGKTQPRSSVQRQELV